MRFLIPISIITVIIIWSVSMTGYTEPDYPVVKEVDESRCFSPECRSVRKFHPDSSKAILLLHGFPATPETWHKLTQPLYDAGWDVWAPLLPGFGCDPKDLRKTGFNTWYRYAEQCYLTLRKTHKTVVVAGHSLGGSLALKIAENHNPDRLITIDSPVTYGQGSNPLFFLARPITLFTPAIGEDTTKNKKPLFRGDGHEEWTGYKGVYAQAGLSITYNLKEVRADLGDINCPILIIHDDKDRTVPYRNSSIIAKETGSAIVERWNPDIPGFQLHTYHSLPYYHSIEKELRERILTFINS